GTPSRISGIGYRGEQAGIDHCSADPEQHAAEQPPSETVEDGDDEQASGLDPHTGGDQALAPPSVAQRPGDDLQGATYRGVDPFQEADALDAQTSGSKEQGEYPPAHAVVQVVDEPGLRCGEQVPVSQRGPQKDLAEAQRGHDTGVLAALQRDMLAGI